MIIQKYGGTSVGNGEKLIQVAKIIEDTHQSEDHLIVVVSAMNHINKEQGTTSQLLICYQLALEHNDYTPALKTIKQNHLNAVHHCIKNRDYKNQIVQFIQDKFDILEKQLNQISPKDEHSFCQLDDILTIGEILATHILITMLKQQQLDVDYLDLSSIIYNRDDLPLNMQFHKNLEDSIRQQVIGIQQNRKRTIVITAGFLGRFTKGILKSIGRGYTDYTAGILAMATQAKELQIWKDVNGIYTANPHLIEKTKLIPKISIKEALELTYLGCEVIHPLSLQRLIHGNIPISIKNVSQPQNQGTLIHHQKENNYPINPFDTTITGIAYKRNIKVISIHPRCMLAQGLLNHIFGILEQHEIVVDMISICNDRVALVVVDWLFSHEIKKLKSELSKLGETEIFNDKCLISLVGSQFIDNPKMISCVMECLIEGKIQIELLSNDRSHPSFSFVISIHQTKEAIDLLHKKLIMKSKTKANNPII